jgi:hypothetical protein
MVTTPLTLPGADEFARMEHELFTRLERSHTRKVRKHRLIAGVAAIALASGGVAAVTVATQSIQDYSAYCYSLPDTGAPSVQLTSPSDTIVDGKAASKVPLPARFADGVAGCQAAWSQGFFARGDQNATGKVFDIPELQACLRDDLAIAVFPKKDAAESAADFCSALGMSPPGK